jgi:hypothetical protein
VSEPVFSDVCAATLHALSNPHVHALTATVRHIRIPAHPNPPTRITQNYSRSKQKEELKFGDTMPISPDERDPTATNNPPHSRWN